MTSFARILAIATAILLAGSSVCAEAERKNQENSSPIRLRIAATTTAAARIKPTGSGQAATSRNSTGETASGIRADGSG